MGSEILSRPQTSDQYLRDLQTINGTHRGGGIQRYRTKDVICLDAFGRTIAFSKPEKLTPEMTRLLAVFTAEFAQVADVPALALTFARFYYAFIAIHPFDDANRRTAFTFMECRAREKSFTICRPELLRRVLLEGNVAEEMQTLRSLLITMLQPHTEGNEHAQTQS